MLHYHGTPISPRSALERLAGRCFCVSFAAPGDLDFALRHAQSVMLDSGAYSAWTRGHVVDWAAYAAWCAPALYHPHWAAIPDVIEGSEADNDALLAAWPHPIEFGAAVWHLNESIERLLRLARLYPRIAFGTAGEYEPVGSSRWDARLDEAFAALAAAGLRPMVHMMRALAEASSGRWPFYSADSTSLARNHNPIPSRGLARKDVLALADKYDLRNPRPRLAPRGFFDMMEDA